jgi:hypothetical protein
MKLIHSRSTFSCLKLLLMAGLPAAASAGEFSVFSFTGDVNSGISPSVPYTARADFNGDGTRSVNGVVFNETGVSGTNYALTGAGGTFTDFANNVTGSSGQMLRDFFFTGDGSGNASLTLSGLNVGQNYVTSWYNTGFGGPGGRVVAVTASDTNTTINFDENFSGAGNGNILRYAFTATTPTITYTFDAVSNPDSFHHYAFSNAAMRLSTPTITHQTGPGPFSPFTVSNNDLLQSSIAGVTSSGNFNQEGAGGIPALADGVFVINGGNPSNNAPLATVENNAFIEVSLNLATSPLGYDISSINTYGGWNDNGRDAQRFSLSYSLVGDATFLPLGSINFEPTAGGDPSAIRATFGTALTGVDAVRIDFFPNQENGYAGLGEIDVIGMATIPEPGSAIAALLGGLGVLARRRQRR